MALAFPSSPTPGQVYQEWTWDGTKWVCTGSPPTTIAANALLGNPTSAVAAPIAVAPQQARSSSLLNIERCTFVGDTNYSILPTDRVLNPSAAFTAPRTWTLPAISSVNPGQKIKFVSMYGPPPNNLTLVCSASDKFFDEGSLATPTSITFLRNASFTLTAIAGVGQSYWSLSWEGGEPNNFIQVDLNGVDQTGITDQANQKVPFNHIVSDVDSVFDAVTNYAINPIEPAPF
jgi:hypothetical protein